ncbi:Histidine kinase [Dyella sp. OK004]|nr:Histidine kinase [Dyella sp. OK004]
MFSAGLDLWGMPVRFLRYMAVWTILVVLFALQGYATDAVRGFTWNASDYIRWSMIQWYTLAALAPAVFWLAARYPIEPSRRLRFLPVHVLASVAFTACAVLLAASVAHILEPSQPPVAEQLSQFISKYAVTDLFVYWVLLVIWHAGRFYREKNRRTVQSAQLQAQLAQSRLQVLKMQLQPHFLFNTLHAISTLIREDAAVAEDMLLRLSDLLRAYLDDDRQEIALASELELLDLYLGIQRIRFKDRLTTRVDAAASALDGAVPGLILQPLVENAIHHGIGKHAGSDQVEVTAYRDADSLYLEVRNHGSTLDMPQEEAFGRGVGLSNSRLRLKELYGDTATIYLDALTPQGVVCRVRLPFRAMPARPGFAAGVAA